MDRSKTIFSLRNSQRPQRFSKVVKLELIATVDSNQMLPNYGHIEKNDISLSVCIITKNEQKKIPYCLESVQWASEIIVLDDFSADDTRKICKSFDSVRYLQNRFTGFGLQ